MERRNITFIAGLASITGLAANPQLTKAGDQSQIEQVATCLRSNSSGDVLKVMGASESDARKYVWRISDQGIELSMEIQRENADRKIIEVDFNLEDKNGDGQVDDGQNQGLFDAALTDTLMVCQTPRTHERNICPGIWSISNDERYKLVTGLVEKVVLLPHPDGQVGCTGSILPGDRVLTAEHCVTGIEPPLRVAIPMNKFASQVELVQVTVIDTDTYSDLALLQLPKGSTHHHFKIAKDEPTGNRVYTLGHGGEYAWVFSTMNPYEASGDSLFDFRNREFSAPPAFCAEPGLSGGPVINGQGELLGVFKQVGANAQIQWSAISTPLEVTRGFLETAMNPKTPRTYPPNESKTCQVAVGEEDLILQPEGRYMAKKFIVVDPNYCTQK